MNYLWYFFHAFRSLDFVYNGNVIEGTYARSKCLFEWQKKKREKSTVDNKRVCFDRFSRTITLQCRERGEWNRIELTREKWHPSDRITNQTSISEFTLPVRFKTDLSPRVDCRRLESCFIDAIPHSSVDSRCAFFIRSVRCATLTNFKSSLPFVFTRLLSNYFQLFDFLLSAKNGKNQFNSISIQFDSVAPNREDKIKQLKIDEKKITVKINAWAHADKCFSNLIFFLSLRID